MEPTLLANAFEPQTITILGAGYVGLTSAALFAQAGFKVYTVEPNRERLSAIKSGKSFFYEAGLDQVIAAGIKSSQLIPTDSYEESVPFSDIVISCVGTPDNPDGSSNLTYVFSAAEHAATLMKANAIFVQKSTVPVGTGEKIEAAFHSAGKTIPYISNPEFLREGTALLDTLYFDRIVAGGNDTDAVDAVLSLYKRLESKRDDIASIAGVTHSIVSGQYIATSLSSAELIKVTANAFLALKISFANSIAKLADASSADIVQVMDAVGADKRIGRAFLNAGRGYGGGCFPKDVSGLIASGLEHGVDLELVQATKQVNNSMPGYVVEKIQDACDGSLQGKTIAVLGLAFKAGTSDARRSPGVSIANILAEAGAIVTAYDPKANKEASDELVSKINSTETLNECIASADVVVIATDWSEFSELTPDLLSQSSAARIIVDAVNCLPKDIFVKAGFTYVGIGR